VPLAVAATQLGGVQLDGSWVTPATTRFEPDRAGRRGVNARVCPGKFLKRSKIPLTR
jgi:hypothetical protein